MLAPRDFESTRYLAPNVDKLADIEAQDCDRVVTELDILEQPGISDPFRYHSECYKSADIGAEMEQVSDQKEFDSQRLLTAFRGSVFRKVLREEDG